MLQFYDVILMELSLKHLVMLLWFQIAWLPVQAKSAQQPLGTKGNFKLGLVVSV